MSTRTLAKKKPAPRPAPEGVLTISFEDNRHLPMLFGKHDEHLALIETALAVEMTPRGNHVAVHGEPEARDAARRTLVALHRRLEAGHEIGPGDVDGALRMSQVDTNIPGGPGSVRVKRKMVGARTPRQAAYIEAIRTHELVFGTGPAGTGKTYLAVACAAEALVNGEVERIILSRPAVEAGERLGFLPGDMKDKVDPYLRPLYDALYDILTAAVVTKGLAENVIEIAPLAFMRGRTLARAFIILDEAQNTTPQQMKMFLTRLGEGSRMVVTGDPTQVDLPGGVTSGLVQALEVLEGVPGVGMVAFGNADIVRHALVGRIVAAYDQAGARRSGSV